MAQKRKLTSAFESDPVILLVGNERRRFVVHKEILSKVDFFANCLRHKTQEQRKNEIELPEDDTEATGKLLEFLYYGTVNVTIYTTTNREEDERQQWITLTKLYIAADKYCMEDLQNWLLDKVRVTCVERIPDAASIKLLSKAGLKDSKLRVFLIRQMGKVLLSQSYEICCEKDSELSGLVRGGDDDSEDLMKACLEMVKHAGGVEIDRYEYPTEGGPACDWHVHTYTAKCGNDEGVGK